MAKVADYERADLPGRTKAALRYVDRLTSEAWPIDRAFYDDLRRDLTDDELLDLGMVAMFFHGWQRLIDAFGIVPDRWREGDALPFGPLRPKAEATGGREGAASSCPAPTDGGVR